MARENSAPLSNEDLKSLNEQLDKLKDADEIADRAIRAGIDVSEQKKRIADMRSQAIRIKQQFFPGK